jgi:hypothetical protein
MKRNVRVNDAFKQEPPLTCATCKKNEAQYQTSITVRRGLDYLNSKVLYHVEYSICADCAREIVEVKLSAKLAV